jgi:DNA-binding beta-propeller fold protein YncE
MILLSGWALGYLVESTDWAAFRKKRGLLLVTVLLVFVTSLTAVISTLIGPDRPFQGRELEQLQSTSTFLMAAFTAIGSGAGLAYFLREWEAGEIRRMVTFSIFGLLAILTARAAFVATYINYDNATEYLVYAHSARGVKDVMDQVLDISRRTTDGLALEVAYDDDVSWPFTWYLRNYTNQRYYASTPTRDLRELPVILVGDDHFADIEPIVGQAFHQFDYIRMVWPDQDYFNLTWPRIQEAVTSPEMRGALFQIWLNRDYKAYTEILNKDLSLPNWNPSDRMRMYVRKDVATKLWDYGVGPAPEEIVADPYEGGEIDLAAEIVLGGEGVEPGQFLGPRGVAVAPDGTIYVADSLNHRIQHLDRDGTVLHTWGSFADAAAGAAPEGMFNEPWGVAVDSEGNVYVADTWNHRVQKFNPAGNPLGMWGYFGQAEDPYAFWGPRDIAVDNLDRVIITDTGNKRLVVFDKNGNHITEIGGAGFAPGKFDEPIGVAVNAGGLVFVADTWNQRVQSLTLDSTGRLFPLSNWDIIGWYGQSLENKPYITVDNQNRVFITDPEGFRIIEFSQEGNFVRYWGDLGSGATGFDLPTGIAADPLGGVWVTDSGNHQLLYFNPPVD